jgi:hypothetical protein
MSDDNLKLDYISSNASHYYKKWGASDVKDESDQFVAQAKDKKIHLKPIEKRDSPWATALGYDLYRKNKLKFLLYLLSWGWLILGAWRRFYKQKEENIRHFEKNIDDNLKVIKESLQ